MDADPLTDGQIAEWRRYLDQGDWYRLVTDDEFRALLDTAARLAEAERLLASVEPELRGRERWLRLTAVGIGVPIFRGESVLR